MSYKESSHILIPFVKDPDFRRYRVNTDEE